MVSRPVPAPVIALSGSRPSAFGDRFEQPIQILGSAGTSGTIEFVPTFLGRQEGEPSVLPYDDDDLGQADESAWFDFLPTNDTGTLEISSTDDLFVDMGTGVDIDDWTADSSGYTLDGPISILVGPSSPVRFRVRPGVAYMADGTVYSFDWAFVDLVPDLVVTILSDLQRAPGTFRVSVSNGVPGAAVTFASELMTIPGGVLDDTGSLISFPVSVPDPLTAGAHLLTVSSPGRDDVVGTYQVIEAPYTDPLAQPDDSDPVAVAPVDGVRKWVLQDPAPAGEEYVFEINPDSATSPWPENVFTTEVTTAPDGQTLTWEGAQRAVQWQFRGKLLTQTQHDALQRFSELNRRVWLIDNRNRAWVVSIEDFDATPRRVPDNPWVHDYVVTAIIYKGPVTPV